MSLAVDFSRPKKGRGRARACAFALVLFAGMAGGQARADRFAEALGVAPVAPGVERAIEAKALQTLASLSSGIDIRLTVPRASLEAALREALSKAPGAGEDGALDGTSFELLDPEIAPTPGALRVLLRARLNAPFFTATIAAAADLAPRLDGGRVVLDAGDVARAVEAAGLKRLTLNAGGAAEKAQPVVAAGQARLAAMLEAAAQAVAIPMPAALAKGGTAKPGAKPIGGPAAFLLDDSGLQMLARLSPPPKPKDDDALITGSIAAAGVTAEQYRAAFQAVRSRAFPGEPAAPAAAELMLAPAAVAGLVARSMPAETCAPIAVETQPVTVAAPLRLPEPPRAPACRRIAETCAARELCAQEAQCEERMVDRTVQETVKVPAHREVCAQREYVCYGWGPYGCAYGERVCVAYRRVTEFKEQTVERVVQQSEAPDTPVCGELRALKAKAPGICGRASRAEAGECALVSGGAASLEDCEARSAVLERFRAKPAATANARIVARGRIEACVTRTLSADLGRVKLVASGSGRAEVSAEITVRAEGRSEADSELRCQVAPAAAVKAATKARFDKTVEAPLKTVMRDGALVLTAPALEAEAVLGLDKTTADALFSGEKGGLTYRCSLPGAGGGTFAAWEARIAQPLREAAAKIGKASASLTLPAFEVAIPAVELLGRPAVARLERGAVVYSIAP